MISHKVWDGLTLLLLLLISILAASTLVSFFVGGRIAGIFSQVSGLAVNIVFVLTIVFIIIVLVLENDNPIRTLAWILVLLYIPVLGFILYLLFGRNWRKTRIFSRKILEDTDILNTLFETGSDNKTEPMIPGTGTDSVHKLESQLAMKLIRLLERNSKAIVTFENRLQIIPDPIDAFELICAAISKAKHHIHLEYFSIKGDETGIRLKNLLLEKARQGVEIRIIYDDVGSWDLGRKFKKDLRRAGIQMLPFMPVLIPFINSRMNYRNHRKLIVIDGCKGFLGGINIADKYLSKSKYFGHWRDSILTHEGESVHFLQAMFLTDWYFVSKENLLKPQYFYRFIPSDCLSNNLSAADNTPAGSSFPVCAVQITGSGPDTDHATILQAYFCAIANARSSIRITTPYLILNESLLSALKTAALSDVKIQIIVPAKADHYIVFWGSRSYYEELMSCGIEFYEYQKGFIHAKILIVDDEILSIGSANMDMRSFNHNFELTAMVYNQSIALQALAQFQDDLASSFKIELEQFRKRSISHKTKESICRLFSPLL